MSSSAAAAYTVKRIGAARLKSAGAARAEDDMKDFDSYSKQEAPEDVTELAKRLTGAFRGKGEGDILRAIYAEAEKGRKNGTLSDAELDNFYNALAPVLDGAKRKKLAAVIGRLKKM